MAEISLSEYANRPASSSSKRKKIPPTGLMVIGAIVLVALGFLIGMQYQKGKTSTVSTTQAASSQSAGGGAGGYGGAEARGDRAFGTVTAVSSSSISVQGRTGTSTTYTLTSSTTVTNNGQSSSVSAIQTGDTVIMTLDSSNTQDVTAIMLNPSFGGGGGAGGYGGGGSSSDSSGSSDDSANNTPSSINAVGA